MRLLPKSPNGTRINYVGPKELGGKFIYLLAILLMLA